MATYQERLIIDIEGNDTTVFQTISGVILATGYERVVIGKRGPYIEFNKTQINHEVIFIPEKELFRLEDQRVYYNEWRSKQDHVKLYEQKRTVGYADYVIGMWYVSPFDLRVDGSIIIRPLRKERDLFA